MPDSLGLLTTVAPPDQLLRDLLAVSLTGVILYTPMYDPAGSGEIVDFTFEYLNPTAQRMMAMPEVPTVTHNQQWPHSKAHGTFQFHVEAYVSGEPREYNVNYQADGYDNYYRLAARRSGPGLLVSFTDTADQPRSPVEVALREAQAAEKAARADAEAQRQLLQEVFHQAPVAIALLDGPTYRITLANPTVCELWTRPEEQLLSRPLLDAMPELQGQGIDTLLDGVLHSGQPFVGTELPFDVVRHGRRETIYFNFVYQPQRNVRGETTGVLVVATDVTPVVVARQKVEAQEQETAALNEELAAANEEIQANNEELQSSQTELLSLNQELEAHVQQRTFEVNAARAEAEEQRNRLERLFRQAPALINLFTGPDHVLTLVHPKTELLLPNRPLLGLPRRQALPELPEEQHEPLDRVYRTGEAVHQPERLTRLDRFDTGQLSDVYLDVVYQPLFDAAGRIEGVMSFALDVTERVRARQEREAQRQQLYDLFMQAPAAICILAGPELVYELVNPGYQDLFPGRELMGRPILDALPEIAGHAVYQGFRDVYDTGVTLEAQALLIPLARPGDGELEDRYFNYIQQARRGPDGRPDGVLVFAFEVTEQVQARQQAQALAAELTTANQQLSRTNVDLDNFIYTASHDLKAPISNLEGLVLLLREELPAAVAQDRHVAPTLTRMLDSVERFKRTIDHLTEVSKLQQAHAPETTAVDLAAVVEDVREDLHPLIQSLNAQLAIGVTDFPPVLFSEKNLRSVVYNLLSNALKYHAPDRRPHVDVRAHALPGFTVLEVHDNGLGIAPEHLPRLFTMFQRFHDHVEGTGIGLYMVQRMVENAGGRIEVHSQLGSGTTFFVHLPHAPVATS
ncbi:PAS domain-containing sensor histidine kinase [Hymenobacter sp. DH14]|uniref:histidine kinase n=1 Tax=Hymenobacter cyanobacteriorum TaxID=2926463 RepID=A0A9X1VPR5_9BACT|nr:PAS domain-containing protein [Hymenobacter cyanobacteriorum]MCI1189821.1 PAS domain-containing sensor histidine kinase [Hymenobacter cyanobacteriorum]